MLIANYEDVHAQIVELFDLAGNSPDSVWRIAIAVVGVCTFAVG